MYPYDYQPYPGWPMPAAPMPGAWGQPAPQVVYVYMPYVPAMPPFAGPQGGPGRGPEGYGGGNYGGRPQGGPGHGPEGYGGPHGHNEVDTVSGASAKPGHHGPHGGEGYAGGNYGGKPHGSSYAGQAAVKPVAEAPEAPATPKEQAAESAD